LYDIYFVILRIELARIGFKQPQNGSLRCISIMYLGMVQDDPKLLGDSGEVPISKWSGWKVIPAVKSSLYLKERTSWTGRKPRAHPTLYQGDS
jgi:hypothetical protein